MIIIIIVLLSLLHGFCLAQMGKSERLKEMEENMADFKELVEDKE